MSPWLGVQDPAVAQELRFCRTPDGVRIAWARHGSGPPLVIVSCGTATCRRRWAAATPHPARPPTCSADLAGLVGVPGTDPRLQEMTLEVQIGSGSPAENVAALEQAWRERCPVLLALTDAVPVDVTFT